MKIFFFILFFSFLSLNSEEIYLPFPDESSEPNFEELEKKILEEEKKQVPKKKIVSKKKKKRKRKKTEVKEAEPLDLSKVNLEKGLFYLNNDNIPKAKDFFQQSVQIQGNFSEQAKIELSKLENTIEQSQGLQEDTKWQSSFEMAKSLHKTEPQRSKDLYLDIITQAPDKYKSIALIAMSTLMMASKQYEDAKTYLINALENYPNHSKKDLVIFYLAEVETKLGNLNQAKIYYKNFEEEEFQNSIYKEIARDKLKNIEY